MATPKSDTEGIRATIHALRDAGWAITHVDDGEEEITPEDENQAISDITAVDQAWLHVKRGDTVGYVFFVMGNDPEEVICDHTVNLSDVLDPLTRSWWS